MKIVHCNTILKRSQIILININILLIITDKYTPIKVQTYYIQYTTVCIYCTFERPTYIRDL